MCVGVSVQLLVVTPIGLVSQCVAVCVGVSVQLLVVTLRVSVPVCAGVTAFPSHFSSFLFSSKSFLMTLYVALDKSVC